MAISISGNESNVVYGKGDTCLKINPFDNYRLFTLYENWKDDDRKPLDLSDGQKIYLVFKSKNKELRTPEYDLTYYGGEITVDKVNGQVLFKISQKNAIDILTFDDHTFYITRVHEVTDMTGDTVISSTEEMVYTGQWKDESSNASEDYSSQIKKLLEIIEEKNSIIKELQESNALLIEQNVNLATELENYKEENAKLASEISELEAKLSEYESGAEYSGTLVGEGTHHTIISNKEYTEEQLAEIIKELESTSVD